MTKIAEQVNTKAGRKGARQMAHANLQETVTCPWFKESFDVEPTSSASGFHCPVCAIESSLGALRNPDHCPNALQISEMGALAGTANFYRHTAAYVNYNKQGEERIGSGTLVQIGDRLLLATVAHTRPKDLSAIALVKKSPLMVPQRVTCVTHRVASADDEIDVGILELSTDAVRKTGLEPIGIDRIHDGGTGNPSVKARLIGYPGQYVVVKKPLPNLKRFHALAYGCEPIEATRWDAIPDKGSATFDEDIHIVIEFSDDVVSYGDRLPVMEGTPEPFGMSGGGIWQRPQPTKDDEIWTPSDLCLFGIQSDWLRKAGYLRLIQIIHWLKLVADEYSDLRSELESRFPRLKQM